MTHALKLIKTRKERSRNAKPISLEKSHNCLAWQGEQLPLHWLFHIGRNISSANEVCVCAAALFSLHLPTISKEKQCVRWTKRFPSVSQIMCTLIKFHKSYQLNYSFIHGLHAPSTANVARIRTLKRPVSFNYSCGNSSDSRSPICGFKNFKWTDSREPGWSHAHRHLIWIWCMRVYEAIFRFRCPPKKYGYPSRFRYPHFLFHTGVYVGWCQPNTPTHLQESMKLNPTWDAGLGRPIKVFIPLRSYPHDANEITWPTIGFCIARSRNRWTRRCRMPHHIRRNNRN